jgi:hypothetical protein
MIAAKAWWMSRGVWGGVVAALAGLAGIWGYSIPAEDQARVVELIVAIVSAVGGVVAVVGRAMAKRPIRRSKPVRKSVVSLFLFSILSACILSAGLAGLTGCAGTSGGGQAITVEQAKAGSAYLESSVATLQKALDDAKAGGDPAKVATAQAVLDQAKSAAAAFAASLPQGDQVEWDAARSLITTAVSVLGPLALGALVAQ